MSLFQTNSIPLKTAIQNNRSDAQVPATGNVAANPLQLLQREATANPFQITGSLHNSGVNPLQLLLNRQRHPVLHSNLAPLPVQRQISVNGKEEVNAEGGINVPGIIVGLNSVRSFVYKEESHREILNQFHKDHRAFASYEKLVEELEQVQLTRLTGKLKRIEQAMVYWMDVEGAEKKYLSALKKKLGDESQALLSQINATEDDSLKEKLKVQRELLKSAYEAEIAKSNALRKNEGELAKGETYIEAQYKQWLATMEEMTGAHSGSSVTPHVYPTRPSKRHDGKPGVYGDVPTAEDQVLGNKRLEVLHGHGSWTRSGPLASGIEQERLPGMTSMKEILERANAIREKAGKAAIAPSFEIAFVGPHGIPSATGRGYEKQPQLKHGAHQDLFDLQETDIAKVEVILDKCKKKDTGNARELAAEFEMLCKKKDPSQKVSESYRKSGRFEQRYVWKDKEHEHLYYVFTRMQGGRKQGESSQLTDIVRSDKHSEMLIPDLRLMSLNPMGQSNVITPSYINELGQLPENVSVSMFEDFKNKPETTETSTSDPRVAKEEANVGLMHRTFSIKLSDAIANRLADLEADDRPVRFFWAACRSELLPSRFDKRMLRGWLDNVAPAMREQLAGERADRLLKKIQAGDE